MTTVPLPAVVDQPCVIDGMPNAIYHADPIDGGSLSSTGARMLLPPSCPAKYRWYADNGQPPKQHFDFGQAAHAEVLGIGDPTVRVEADDWRTKAAKAERDEAYANGEVPLLAADHDRVQGMAAAIRAHPLASALFDPDTGRPEVSLFWLNDVFGVWCRARLDWLSGHRITVAGRPHLVIPDYKTAASSEPAAIAKAMHSFGYHSQMSWYLDGAKELDLSEGLPILPLLVVQEKDPPYVVTIGQPDAYALRVAATRNYKALDVFAACVASGVWPGYSDEVVDLSLPGFAEYEHEAAVDRGDFDIDWQLPLPKESATT